jgi:hypothetical protein
VDGRVVSNDVVRGDGHPSIDQNACMDARKKYITTAYTSLPEEKLLDVRNMPKTL